MGNLMNSCRIEYFLGIHVLPPDPRIMASRPDMKHVIRPFVRLHLERGEECIPDFERLGWGNLSCEKK